VYVPDQAPWKPELMSQLMRFPAGKYDDGVDVCSLIGRGLEHARTPAMPKAVVQKPQLVQRHNDGLGWMG